MDINKECLEKFKQRLSPLAQKVLDKLLAFKRENSTYFNGDTNKTFETRPKASNRKVIVFDDIPNNISACQISYKKANHFADASFSEIEENTTPISRSEELLLPVTNVGHTSYTQQYTVLQPPELTLETFNYNYLEKKPSVDWNDFLHEDFFDDLDCIPKDILDEKHKNDKVDITCNIENSNMNFQAKDEKLTNVSKPIVAPKIKKPTKNKSNKVKKLKTEHDKTSFRKEKYTKAVKNWLNDVKDTVDEATPINNNDRNNVTDETNKKKNKEMKKKVKKIVQAQLANMGGVMKFARPKPDRTEDQSNSKPPTNDFKLPAIEDSNKVEEKQPPKEPITDKPKSKESVKVKDKKTRSKFVAPVLTPLPVTDVTYVVHVLDQTHRGDTLFKLENTEIVTVLLYSNGFNQLNCQYAGAGGADAADGVMFGVGDQYYYIKDFSTFTEEAICNLISNNTLISFNAKEVLMFLMDRYDLSSCSYNIVDLKIGASLLNPDEPPDTFTKLQKLLGNSSQFSIASDCPLQKCARYMSLLWECDGRLREMLADAGMWKLFTDIEMQVLSIIAEMEHLGICVDEDHLKQLDATLLARMKEVELKCYAAAGRTFQINSALQVRNIVYGELRLDEKCNVAVRETVCKAKSTSEAMLRLLTPVHPLPALVLQYRQLHKARATFVAGILHHARLSVVRPTWEQNAAVTGRIACSNPNLQAIPKTFSLSLDTEEEYDGAEACAGGGTLSFRGAYVARAGRVLLAADFRHAECRVLALAAADATLTGALASPDLFVVLAAQWLGRSEAGVSPAERERTKRLVYAGLYGAGARKLAEILRMSEERAQAVIDDFHKSFPALRRFGADVVSAARGGHGGQGGRLRTAGGRARRLPQLSSDDRAARAHAERQAVNFIVQGSAADLCKSAMVECGAALRRAGLAARPLLQIHDELVWELPPQQLPAAARVVKSAMEGCGARVGLPAAFPVQLSAGPSWGHLAPYSV